MSSCDLGKDVKFDFTELRKRAVLKFGSLKRFAEEIGLDYSVLIGRLTGRSYFRPRELKACIEKLGLSYEEAQCVLFKLDKDPFKVRFPACKS